MIDIEHYSPGNFSREWLNAIIEFHNRWADILTVDINEPTLKKQKSQERIAERFFIATLMVNNIGDTDYIRQRLISDFIKHPVTKKTFSLIKQYYDYIKKV